MLYKLLLFLALSSQFNLKTCNEKVDDNFIAWTPYKKITWEDFKGPVNDSVGSSAISVAFIKLDAKFKNEKLKSYEVNCLFSKNESWYRDTADYLLNHEQGHFDIAEIVARQLRQRLAEKIKMEENLNSYEIKTLYDEYVQKLSEMQTLYDEETLHSQRTKGQEFWNKEILKKLNNLKDYKGRK